MSGPLLLPTWEQLALTRPRVVATMRAYLAQVTCVLRPGSVAGAASRCARSPPTSPRNTLGCNRFGTSNVPTSKDSRHGWRSVPDRTGRG
jgi:hypothetical protein